MPPRISPPSHGAEAVPHIKYDPGVLWLVQRPRVELQERETARHPVLEQARVSGMACAGGRADGREAIALLYLTLWVLVLQARVLEPKLQPVRTLHLVQLLPHGVQACFVTSVIARHRGGLAVRGTTHEVQTLVLGRVVARGETGKVRFSARPGLLVEWTGCGRYYQIRHGGSKTAPDARRDVSGTWRRANVKCTSASGKIGQGFDHPEARLRRHTHPHP